MVRYEDKLPKFPVTVSSETPPEAGTEALKLGGTLEAHNPIWLLCE